MDQAGAAPTPMQRWTAREGALVAAGYLALTLLVFLPLLSRIGLLHDDWSSVVQDSTFASGSPLSIAADTVARADYDRPVGAFFSGAMFSAFGEHQALYVVVLGALALLGSLLFYAVLRLVGGGRTESVLGGVLLLFVPASDALRLWPSGGGVQLSVVLLLAGLVVALAGARTAGGRAVAVHAVALVLYAGSVLAYEASVAIVPLLFLLYRTRTTWRGALRRGAADWAATAVLVAYVFLHTSKVADTVSSTDAGAGDRGVVFQAVSVVGQQLLLVASAAGSFTIRPGVRASVTIAGLLFAVAVLALVWVVVRALRDPATPGVQATFLRRWLTYLGGAALVLAAGAAPLIATRGYGPLNEGVDNRVNLVSALGLVVAVPALLVLLAAAVPRLRANAAVRRRLPLVTGVVVVAVFAQAFARRASDYADAHRLQQEALSFIEDAVPAPPHDTMVVVFGVPKETAPRVPVFYASWDLTGALQALWHDRSVHGAGVGSLDRLGCDATGVHGAGPWYPAWHEGYDDVLFVDVARRRVAHDLDEASCRRLTAAWSSPAR